MRGRWFSSPAIWQIFSTLGWFASPWQVGGLNPEISRRNLGRNGPGLLVVSLRKQSSQILFLSLGPSLPKLSPWSRGSRNLILTASLANLKDSKLWCARGNLNIVVTRSLPVLSLVFFFFANSSKLENDYFIPSLQATCFLADLRLYLGVNKSPTNGRCLRLIVD